MKFRVPPGFVQGAQHLCFISFRNVRIFVGKNGTSFRIRARPVPSAGAFLPIGASRCRDSMGRLPSFGLFLVKDPTPA